MHESLALVHGLRGLVSAATLYGRSSLRVMLRGHGRGTEERLVFVVGSPRSGTTFIAEALGAQPGFVDLGEVKPLKIAIPELFRLPEDEAALKLRHVLERVRRFGLVRHLRGVEQTPELSFVLAAALSAYPLARAIHLIRDGRDVVCSLLERGWLSATRRGVDDVGYSYGAQARFWVEHERAEEFERVSDARRAAMAWCRYVNAARAVADRTIELRYETLVSDSAATAERVAEHLHADPLPLAEAFASAHERSVGRWQRDLTPEQLADVVAEAGPLLRELGYVQPNSAPTSS